MRIWNKFNLIFAGLKQQISFQFYVSNAAGVTYFFAQFFEFTFFAGLEKNRIDIIVDFS